MKHSIDKPFYVPPLVATINAGIVDFTGVRDEDAIAEITVFKNKHLGLIFRVSPDVEWLMRQPFKFLCPANRDRIEEHMTRLIEEEMIMGFVRGAEKEFDIEFEIDDWKQHYTYYIRNDQRVRALYLEHAPFDDMLERQIIWRLTSASKAGAPYYWPMGPAGMGDRTISKRAHVA